MNNLIKILLTGILVGGCSSTPQTVTKYNEPLMRVFLYPETLKKNGGKDYDKVLSALMETNLWTIVDRSSGYKAALEELERAHGESGHRFDDKEKWQHFGKLFSVGAIIVPKHHCKVRPASIGVENWRQCSQFLQLVNASTGETIVMTEGFSESKGHYSLPDWTATVEKFNQTFLNIDRTQKYLEKIRRHQEHSRKLASEAREQKKERRRLKRAQEKVEDLEDLKYLLEKERMIRESY